MRNAFFVKWEKLTAVFNSFIQRQKHVFGKRLRNLLHL